MIINAINPYVKTQNYIAARKTSTSFGRYINSEIRQKYESVIREMIDHDKELQNYKMKLENPNIDKYEKFETEAQIKMEESEIKKLVDLKDRLERMMRNP